MGRKEENIQKTNVLRLSTSKTPSKVKRHLLRSFKNNDVTKIASRDNIGNVTLTAQGS